ncbi:hypothetical protein V6N11_012662 [Hibiscus sabdariffa]|uniref:Uncharacterized protein n=1 Tax=Hibiscus sabdariffa TaxID=183260 RepID=A0ABR2QC86_9ROSI
MVQLLTPLTENSLFQVTLNPANCIMCSVALSIRSAQFKVRSIMGDRNGARPDPSSAGPSGTRLGPVGVRADRRARGATATSARSAKRHHCTGGPPSEPRSLSWKLSASNFSFLVLFLESNLQNAMIEHSPSSSPLLEASPGEMRLPPEGFRRSLSSSWIRILKIARKQTETLHGGRASSSPICGFHR